jgi:hypothetical protein
MNDARLDTIEQIGSFFSRYGRCDFRDFDRGGALHTFIATVLKRLQNLNLTKGQRSILFGYMQRLKPALRSVGPDAAN